jgi:hypothetical protein
LFDGDRTGVNIGIRSLHLSRLAFMNSVKIDAGNAVVLDASKQNYICACVAKPHGNLKAKNTFLQSTYRGTEYSCRNLAPVVRDRLDET